MRNPTLVIPQSHLSSTQWTGLATRMKIWNSCQLCWALISLCCSVAPPTLREIISQSTAIPEKVLKGVYRPRIQRWNQLLEWLLWSHQDPGTFRLNVNIKHQIISACRKLQCSVWSKNILCYPWDSPGWGQYNKICCHPQIQVCVLMFNTEIKGTGGGLFPMAEEK